MSIKQQAVEDYKNCVANLEHVVREMNYQSDVRKAQDWVDAAYKKCKEAYFKCAKEDQGKLKIPDWPTVAKPKWWSG